jgi:phosphopantothenoylcysteine decarboxylase/phosphopantothenate--cysteine ligase
VLLVSGPSNENVEGYDIDLISVVSAEDMYKAVHQQFSNSDVAIFSAAVADFRPLNIHSKKIKKSAQALEIQLEPTKDILKSVGAIKKHQYLVGFALETDDEISNAKGKLKSKNLDLIVLNSLNDAGAGFGGSTNKVTFISKSDEMVFGDLKSKSEVATDLWNFIMNKLNV